MVLELLSMGNLILNEFFATHIIFISHVLAAVFLILTETTVNMRIIAPMLDMMENMFLGYIPFVPNLITTMMFIVWATFSIFVYQVLFEFLLNRYAGYLTLFLGIAFVLITLAVNFKYRD